MRTKDRLREATKQLDIVADDDEITSGQREAAGHMASLVENLSRSIERCEEIGVIEDGQLRVAGGESDE